MPILWRYLISNFLKVFFLSTLSFISVLIVLRAQNIAKFAATQEGIHLTCLFTLLQLPYILPFAICFSALLSSFLLVKTLSENGGLTCLRSFGLSLQKIFFPLYCLSFWLGCLNFILISEICPLSKKKSKELLNLSLQKSPLALLEEESFKRSQHLLSLSKSENALHKKDVILAFSSSQASLSLVLAQDLNCAYPDVKAHNIHIFSFSKDPGEKKTLIEYYNSLQSSTEALVPRYRKYHPTFTFEELTTKNCLIKLFTAEKKEQFQGMLEILKRLFFLCTPMSFFFIGITCSLSLGRESKASFKRLIVFTLVILSSYFFGKSLQTNPVFAAFIFFLPQLASFVWGSLHLRKVQQGSAA